MEAVLVLLGGVLSMAGGFLQWRLAEKGRERERLTAIVAGLAEETVSLFRAAVDAGEHAGDESWRPTRLEGVAIRVTALAGRLGSPELNAKVGALREQARILAEEANLQERKAGENGLMESVDEVNHLASKLLSD